jgi:hypothetical protein
MSFNLPHKFNIVPAPRRCASRCVRMQVACLTVISILAFALSCAAQNAANPCKPSQDPGLTAPPDAKAQTEKREPQKQAKQADNATADEERKKQVADETAKLLKLATELKTEVDKSSKDTLSLDVIRKADEIERLARSVREKMKLEGGGN